MTPKYLCVLTILFIFTTTISATQPKFPAILVFGDSLVDTGNNNFIDTTFKANHFPYGQLFPGHIATGRFTDGKMVPDMLASSLGIKDTVPPFLDPNLTDDDVKTGVDFASAGSGYDDLTTSLSGVIAVSKQAEYLKDYVERLKRIVGEGEATKILNCALVLIVAGSNDFALNYFPMPTRKAQFTLDGYQDFLQENLQNFVKNLYNVGLRKMAIGSLPPFGCWPGVKALKLVPLAVSCSEIINAGAKSYNDKLVNKIPQLQASLPGSQIVYADIYGPLLDMGNNPQNYGFVVADRGCCGTGFVELAELCTPITPTCLNSSQYMFWDSAHPTQSAYTHVATSLLTNVLPTFH
ncbi:GDSL esterase/lipase At2g30310-like [Malania oleifera]|uniref:GDSL esterase/lipase At2g30310-like n=1 Tax=Malania oleifera TaxID=397392 RepID=UPI0025AE3F15|nr:GDSL esterase/lipase At2g30310-like [Malania oleifera]XP_057956693.1 GDSL esterase/lipase At2g30310-like [Malania oleifera]